MTTKEKVLELFEKNKGIYFSGEELAKQLNVSRASVWKAVTGLGKDGYAIDAVTNKGYCLSERGDILSAQGIMKYLPSEYQNMDIRVERETESTNAAVREYAEQGMQEGVIRPVRIPILKMMLEASLEQFFQRDILLQNEITYAQALQEVVGILMYGIASER